MRCRMLLRGITAGTGVGSQAKLWNSDLSLCQRLGTGTGYSGCLGDSPLIRATLELVPYRLKDAVRDGINFHVVLPGMPDD